MARTIHVTVSYSVHVENDKLSDRQAKEFASHNYEQFGTVFDSEAIVFDRYKEQEKPKPRRGIGSY